MIMLNVSNVSQNVSKYLLSLRHFEASQFKVAKAQIYPSEILIYSNYTTAIRRSSRVWLKNYLQD